MSDAGGHALLFCGDPSQKAAELRASGLYVCEMRDGIASLAELHDELSRRLKFPDWYGRNWNALDELLSDLSWLPGSGVAIVHIDVPSLDTRELALYVKVLSEAVEESQAKARRFVCVLPREASWLEELLGVDDHGQFGLN